MTGRPRDPRPSSSTPLEQRARGIYSGAFGYVGLDGAIDLAMVIRSIVVDGAGSTVGTGEGITALSDPGGGSRKARLSRGPAAGLGCALVRYP